MSRKTTSKKKKEEIIEIVQDPFPTSIYFEEVYPKFVQEIKVKSLPRNNIRNKLLEKMKERELQKDKDSEESDGEENLEEFAEDGLTKIRKENIFKEELTDNEKDLILKRQEIQKQKFERLQKKREKKIFDKIRTVHAYLTDDEIKTGLEECEQDEERVTFSFTDPYFLKAIREHIARKYEKENPVQIVSTPTHTRKKKTVAKKTQEETTKRTRKNRGKGYIYKKLKLDEAIAQGNFDGWSPARIQAFKMIDSNPNAYYYRFNAPNEQQRNGKWTEEEKKLFFERLKTHGPNHNWGIFSMTIPGRVGYQCSNFYRQLIESGQITDPSYIIGPNGKAKYIFGKGKNTQIETGEGQIAINPKPKRTRNVKTKKTAAARKKRKTDSDDDDDDDDGSDEDFLPSGASKSTGRRRTTRSSSLAELFEAKTTDKQSITEEVVEEIKKENILPGFVDPITLDEVVDPMISPYGHVMSRHSWVSCLTREDSKNICPLTKKPLNRRELIPLTWENIEEYRSKIVNL